MELLLLLLLSPVLSMVLKFLDDPEEEVQSISRIESSSVDAELDSDQHRAVGASQKLKQKLQCFVVLRSETVVAVRKDEFGSLKGFHRI